MGCQGSTEKSYLETFAAEARALGIYASPFANADVAFERTRTRRENRVRRIIELDNLIKLEASLPDLPRRHESHVFLISTPSLEGQIYRCFEEGILYRIENDDGIVAYYNDSPWHEIHVRRKYAPEAAQYVFALEGVNVQELQSAPGWKVFSTVVYPGQTVGFVKHVHRKNANVGEKSAPKLDYTTEVKCEAVRSSYMERIKRETSAIFEGERAQLKAIDLPAEFTPRQQQLLVLAHCVRERMRFVDRMFAATNSRILISTADQKNAPPTFATIPFARVPGGQLFRNRIRPHNIKVGLLGNSWFASAVAALAEFPMKVRTLFQTSNKGDEDEEDEKAQAAGAYRVWVVRHGWWIQLILDDYLPMLANGECCFSRTALDPQELWVSLLEKAYAKAHGNYWAIRSGDSLCALMDLTGFPWRRFDESWQKAYEDRQYRAQVFHFLRQYCRQGNIVLLNTPNPAEEEDQHTLQHQALTQTMSTAAFLPGQRRSVTQTFQSFAAFGESFVGKDSFSGEKGDCTDVGLRGGYAYQVKKVVLDPESNLKLVKIKDPWNGGKGWKGPWCDGHYLWHNHETIAKMCEYGAKSADDDDEDCFWMQWEDILKYFCGGGVCFHKIGWTGYRIKGEFVNALPTVALEVHIRTPTQMFITLSQEDCRSKVNDDDGSCYKYDGLLVAVARPMPKSYVYEVHQNSAAAYDEPSYEWTYINSRDVGLKYNFEPNQRPYIIIPRILRRQTPKSYVLALNVEYDSGLEVFFRRLDPKLPVFDNFRTFLYDPLTAGGAIASGIVCATPTITQYQRREDGCVPATHTGLGLH